MENHQTSKRLVNSGFFHTFPVEKFVSWGLLVFAFLFWAFSLNSFNLREMNDLGLISIFPPSIILAYVLALVGFSYSIVRFSDKNLLLAFILLLILMIHGTPQILYGTLRYSWAWKHVGIVDYIIRHGSVDPTIRFLDVYHNWPGFFALSALFTQLAELPGAQTYAGWAPVFFETLFAIGLLSLFRLFTTNVKLQYLAVWIFILTNWIGQDYFSPQATAYLMLIGVLVLLLLSFGSSGPTTWSAWRDRYSNSRISKLFAPAAKWISSMKITRIQQEVEIGGSQRVFLGGLILMCFFTIIATHQLTPFIGVEIVLMLILFGYLRWKTLPILVSILLAFWLLGPARPYNAEIVDSIISAFGKFSGNINSGLINVAHVSAGQAVVAWVGRGLTILIGILAILGLARRIRNHHLDLLVILLAGLPVLTALVNSYGGELIFRVYFFSLPALAFLAAGLFLPKDDSVLENRDIVSVSVVSFVLLIGLLFGYYGKDQQYYFTQQEVKAAEYVYTHAPPNTLLIEGSRDYPSQFKNYEYFTYIPIDREPAYSRSDFLENPVSVFHRWMSNPEYSASYLIITRSQKISSDTLGTLPPGSLERIQEQLENSDAFDVVYSNQDAVVFVAKPRE